jgi:arginyl-tRNA synthetase
MKPDIKAILSAALDTLIAEGRLTLDERPEIQVDRAKDSAHGDFATNLALLLAKPARAKPRDLAEQLVAALPASPLVARVEIAGPGFINFFLAEDAYCGRVRLGQSERPAARRPRPRCGLWRLGGEPA